MRNMFRKSDLVDDLSRDLCRARDKRDALASDVTTLTAQIAKLEARLSGVEKGIGLLKETIRPERS